MELSAIVELITSLGFPIVCVIALAFFIWKIYNQSVAREEKLMTEITENRLVNQQAVETIAKFAERFNHIEEDISGIKNDVGLIKQKIE